MTVFSTLKQGIVTVYATPQSTNKETRGMQAHHSWYTPSKHYLYIYVLFERKSAHHTSSKYNSLYTQNFIEIQNGALQRLSEMPLPGALHQTSQNKRHSGLGSPGLASTWLRSLQPTAARCRHSVAASGNPSGSSPRKIPL